MAVTAYKVLEDWALREVFLAFEHVPQFHTGHSLALILDWALHEHELSERFYGITINNVSNNKIIQSQLAEILANHCVE